MNRGRVRRFRTVDGLTVAVAAIVLIVAVPFAALVSAAWEGSPELWTHLIRYVIPAATLHTAVLLAGVGLLTIVIGTALAWLVTAFSFPGRRWLDGCLVLPLAVPTYIVAYAYLDMLHPVGPVQDALRAILGYESPREFRLPDIRSMTGCITLLGFVLYPYVYLPTRALFAMQSASLIESGRTLGLTRWQTFRRIALPLARPAIAVGLSLALMEALNDIGASEFMGVRTLTVAIYSAWVTRSDLPGAAQIAVGLLALVLALMLLERWARRHQRYSNDAQHPRPLMTTRLSPLPGLLAVAATVTPILIGFGFPFIYLIRAAFTRIEVHGVDASMIAAFKTTVLFSAAATLVAVAAGVTVAYAIRRMRAQLGRIVLAAGSIGYATPGTVVGIAILPVITGADRLIDRAAGMVYGGSTGLLLLGSGAAVIYAYVVRFLAVPLGGAESAFAKVPPSLDDAAAMLGASPRERLMDVHMPLIRRAVIASGVLMFVDCVKELPATLLLRPLGVETLATVLYGEAARGTYESGAVAALLIVSISVLPVWLLSSLVRDERTGRSVLS